MSSLKAVLDGQENLIEVESVKKYFQSGKSSLQVLDDISFNMRKGTITCIVGASGCGKSTLLRAIAGIDTDYEGKITIEGKEITKPEKNLGLVFQEHRLFPWLTVKQNIEYALDGMPKVEKEKLSSEYIRLVGLEGFEKSFPAQLSGGMAQRAGIARALVNRPPVLLLDEPFGALDTFTKISMQNELKRIQKTSGTTMLMVTHDIDEAVYLADQIIVLSARPGKIKKTINVELPEPRKRNDYDFLMLRSKIFAMFFEETRVEDYTI